jgi:(2R)-ethylmalonyl-CoA mutase
VSSNGVRELRAEIERLEKVIGRRPKVLVTHLANDKVGAAEQIALKARDAGFDVVYQAEVALPEQVVTSAVEEGVHLIGLATDEAAGGLAPDVERRARAAGLGGVPVVVSGAEPVDSAFLRRMIDLVAARA